MQKLVWKRFLHGPFYNVEIGFTSYPSNELSVISDSYIVRPLPRRKHLQSGGRSGRHGGRGSVRHLYRTRRTIHRSDRQRHKLQLLRRWYASYMAGRISSVKPASKIQNFFVSPTFTYSTLEISEPHCATMERPGSK